MLSRGDKVTYTATAPKYDPLHKKQGTVTVLNEGYHEGTYYKGGIGEVWVVWSDNAAPSCWVDLSYLTIVR